MPGLLGAFGDSRIKGSGGGERYLSRFSAVFGEGVGAWTTGETTLFPPLCLSNEADGELFLYRDRFLKNGGYTNETHHNAARNLCSCSLCRSRASCPPTSNARTCTCVCGHWGACTCCRCSPTARGGGATAVRGGGILWLSASALATETLEAWPLATGVLGTPSPSPPLAPLVSGNARAKEVARCLRSDGSHSCCSC